MNDPWYWWLLGSLLLLALGTSLSAVKSDHAKKLSDDECTRLRGQIDALNDQQDKKPLHHQPVESPAVNQEGERDESTAEPEILHRILALIAKYHSQNDTATPKRIAADMSLDPELTLAHMWKYHNEQFITFNCVNGGGRPDVNTPFFLSPAAWQHIKVVRA